MTQLYVLLLLFLVVTKVRSIRTRESWEKLFRTNTRIHYLNEEKLQQAQLSYSISLKDSVPNPFVLRYAEGCGLVCHEEVKNRLRFINRSHYDIVNRDHSLVHVDLNTVRSLSAAMGDAILDFAPVLPSMKIDGGINVKNYCITSKENSVPYHVVLMPISQEEVDQLIEEAPHLGGGVFADFSDISPHSSSVTAVITVPCSLAESMLEYLSKRNTVQWIEIRPEMRFLTEYANGIVQSGDPGFELLHEANLEGEGQIVGIADSGLDIFSCFFYDRYVDTPFNKVNMSHRKVIYYNTFADAEDADGHGTLVCGTAAGQVKNDADFSWAVDSYSAEETSTATVVDDESYRDSFTSSIGAAGFTIKSGIFSMQRGLMRFAASLKSIGSGRPSKGNGDSNIAGSNAAAYKSKISFFDIGMSNGRLRLPSDINRDLFSVLYETGAKVQSMSWGTDTAEYDTDARNVDIFMWENPDALVLVAAGNTGDVGPGSIGSPATNKNGVAVGASLNSKGSWEQFNVKPGTDYFDMDSLASFSSRGPTFDNRLKPDVCAPGYYITGAVNSYPVQGSRHCAVSESMGTSFSCPLLASHAILVREYFTSGFYPSGYRTERDGFTPSGALLKAVLIHGGKSLSHIQSSSAEEMTPMTHGDNNQGYGRTQLDKALSFYVNATLEGLTYFVIGAADSSSQHYAELSSGDDPHVYTFRTADSGNLKPIRVTLAYTDYYPSAGVKTNVLINDLDIVLSNGTHSFYPIVTDTDNKYDRLNNVEVITLFSPPRNTSFTVTVTAHSVLVPQPYALVISGEVGELTYKKRKDHLLIIIAAIVVLVFVVCVLLYICNTCRDCRRRRNIRNEKMKSVQPEPPVTPYPARTPIEKGSQAVRPVARTAEGSVLM